MPTSIPSPLPLRTRPSSSMISGAPATLSAAASPGSRWWIVSAGRSARRQYSATVCASISYRSTGERALLDTSTMRQSCGMPDSTPSITLRVSFIQGMTITNSRSTARMASAGTIWLVRPCAVGWYSPLPPESSSITRCSSWIRTAPKRSVRCVCSSRMRRRYMAFADRDDLSIPANSQDPYDFNSQSTGNEMWKLRHHLDLAADAGGELLQRPRVLVQGQPVADEHVRVEYPGRE